MGNRSHRTSRPEGGEERGTAEPEPATGTNQRDLQGGGERGTERRNDEQRNKRARAARRRRHDATVARRGPVQRSSRGARGTRARARQAARAGGISGAITELVKAP